MPEFPWIPVTVSVLLAILPVIIWMRVIFKRKKAPDERRSLIAIFIGGSLSVAPIFLLQLLWEHAPALDPFRYVEGLFANERNMFIATFVLVGIMEEMVKHLVVRYADKQHPEQFQSINDAIRTSVVSGLGFAFAENIFYFTNIWINLGIADLISAFVFRSVFTAAGHMIFSGIFGYHFGVAKFAADITETGKWSGQSHVISRLFAKALGPQTKTYEVFRKQKIWEGLVWAMGIHAVFNFLLQINLIVPVMVLISLSGLFLYYLLQRATGDLLFSLAARRPSSMHMKDETVVLELIGQWSNEGRYEEVIGICERLLRRDPDNNVVKLFRAKAHDNQEFKTFYNAVKDMFAKEKTAGAETVAPTETNELPALSTHDEKVVTEVMDMWFKKGNYKQVIEVANRLIARNPNSKGARLIRKQAFDKQKLKRIFDSLSLIFSSD